MNKNEILNEKLEAYGKSDYYPFHMPGHKRNPSCVQGNFPIDRDITEIEGFDNLHHAEGILKEAQKKASEVYGTLETFYSVNGSTAALLSAISAAVSRNGKILMARNSHKAVYHATYLRNLRPVYIYPQLIEKFGINGGILPEDVDNYLKNDKEIEAVLVTSPTYDGVVSDIKKIAEIAHKYDVPLIVDEAHGAHFKFSEYFPTSAVELGADLVIQSVHKTLPSMTQTAFLHRCSDRVEREKLQMFMGIYQSSSPSYILMASIDSCMEKIQQDGEQMFVEYCRNLEQARRSLAGLKHVQLLTEDICGKDGVYDYDKSKILLVTNVYVNDLSEDSSNEKIDNCSDDILNNSNNIGTGLNGRELHEILFNKYHLEVEMEAENYVTALTSVGDTKEGFDRLCAAMEEIDQECARGKNLYQTNENYVIERNSNKKDNSDIEHNSTAKKDSYIQLEQRLTIGDALESMKQRISIEECEGRISAEFVYLYPPGIPILVPGELITRTFIENFKRYKIQGLSLQGLSDFSNETILVVKLKIND